MKISYIYLFILFVVSGCSKEYGDEMGVIRGRVLNIKTNGLIANAKIRALDETVFTDQNGDYEFSLDLGKYILDYIEFEIEADDFNKEFVTVRIVADINSGENFDFFLTPKDQLIYSPTPVELLENETEKVLNLISLGVNNVSVVIQPLDNWITISPTSGIVEPNTDFPLEISTNTASFECLAIGAIEVRQVDKNIKDTITITKFIDDLEIPLADFTYSPSVTLQFDSILFDAANSQDNCEFAFPLSYRWQWNTDEGFTTWETTALNAHPYDTYGQKTVTLEVKDRAGNTSSTTKIIDVSIAPTSPEVELGLITETDNLSLQVGANVIDIGQLSSGIISHGAVWSNTNPSPNLENSLGYTEDNELTDIGGFNSEVTGLRIDQTYYVRAYAANNNGVGYSEVQEITPNLLDMVDVLNGTFRMGDDTAEDDDNSPEHDVIISTSFQISRYEVTNQQYVVFLNDEGDLSGNTLNWIDINDDKCRIGFQNNEFIVETGYENYPVVSVSWEGAMAFCNWIGGRLPTEAEWEYCARGGSAVNPTDYTLYSGSNSPGQVAYYFNNSGNGTLINPVGGKEPNELGLYDMSGSVSEWCQDWYSPTYYSNSSVENPLGASMGTKKVARGGNYGANEELITVFYREQRTATTTNNHFGFRCVK